jgi:hypothetical protein
MPRRIGLFLMAALAALASAGRVSASGELIKASGPAVYYVSEGKRYVFPNEKVFFSWYADFDGVRTVPDGELADYQIGGNVTYRPAARLVKLQSDPKVYAVGAGGTLRWVASETAARELYGADWSRKVDDISDAFFLNYRTGEPVASSADFDVASESSVPSIADDLAVRGGGTVSQAFVARKLGSWSDPATWGGARPTSGAEIVIPQGVKVVYDMESGPSFKKLDVDGTLEFWPMRSARLSGKLMTVRGKLQVGTAEAPWPANLTAEIALTGATDLPLIEDGLRVDGGTLDLHGAPVSVAWTRLAAPAFAGDSEIVLDRPVDWKAGQEVVVASTSHDPSESEIRVITKADGATVSFDRPLSRDHRAEDGLRAEVALLTRNVIVRGAGSGLGSSVSFINRATARVEDAVFTGLGRKGVYGRQTVLFDGIIDGSKSVFRRTVIRENGNRCLALRQVENLAVEEVVAFRNYGHCFSTLDGAELKNRFASNLVIDQRPGTSGAGDALPAGFYLRHPGNALEGNVVVGSAGHGYWYELPDKAYKNNGVALVPREAPLGVWTANEARAAMRDGLHVDDDGKGRMNYIPSTKAVFSGLKAVMNADRGFWIRGAGIEVSGAYLAENRVGGTFAAFGATLKDSVVAGHLPGTAQGDLDEAPFAAGNRYGFTFYDGPVSLADTLFRDFAASKGRKAAALGFEEKNDRLPDPRNAYRGVSFVDAQEWYAPPPDRIGDRLAVVRDVDSGTALAPLSPFLEADCEELDGAGVKRCPGAYAQLLVALRESPGDRNVVVTNQENAASVTLAPGAAFDGEYAYVTVAEGGAYRTSVPGAVRQVLVEYDGAVRGLTLRLPAGPATQVRSLGAAVERKSLAELIDGAWAYDDAKGEAVLRLPPGASWDIQW